MFSTRNVGWSLLALTVLPAAVPTRPLPYTFSTLNRKCKTVVYLGQFSFLSNRSSLNLLHSVKNRAPAAIQVSLSISLF